MPITNNRLARNLVVRTTATGSFLFTDMSVNYDGDRAGTVAITGVNATSSAATMSTDFANGDFMYAVVNSTLSETRVVNQVVNTTFANVTVAWTAANASTTYRKSERVDAVDIDTIAFSSNGTWTIARGANTIAVLQGTDHWPLAQWGMALTEDRGANVVITLSASSTGTLVMELSKKSVTSNNQLET